MKTGIIVLGHGSKAAEALVALTKVKDMVAAQMPNMQVVVASMEFNEPNLSQSVAALVAEGIEDIIVAPFFLFFGIHMQQDIPELIAQEKAKYPQIEIKLAANLGTDARLADILMDRIKEVS